MAGGISIWQLLIILAIVVMLFGTKRLRTLGSDLGAAIKGFRNTMSSESAHKDTGANETEKSEEEGAPSADADPSADSNKAESR